MIGMVQCSHLAKACTGRIIRHFALGSPKFIDVVESRTSSFQSKFSCDVLSGNHKFVSDLTRSANGGDCGPSPKELLMSALGSCTAMTIRTVYENSKAFAEKKQQNINIVGGGISGWAGSTLDGIHVRVQEWGEHPHLPDKLTIRIQLLGNLSSEQKDTLMKASTHCPVKMMLTNGIRTETAFQEDKKSDN